MNPFGRRATPPAAVTAPLFELDQLAQCPRAANIGAIRAMCANAYVGNETALCRVLGRYKMYVDSTDVGLSSHLLLDGYWELWVTEALVERLKPGMTCIDVGANIGYFTMIMAERTGPNGIVHAFEPNPALTKRLAMSAHVNGFQERVVIHGEGVGDEDGARFTLHVPENYPSGAWLKPEAEGVPDGATTVAVRRLDSYPELLDADVIKIDAEGAEPAIWRGMAGILARGRPLVIFLEFVKGRYEDPGAYVDEVVGHGFTIHQVIEETRLVPISREQILALAHEENVMLLLTR